MEDLNLGEKLQSFRTTRKMSIRELSQKTGITPSMLSQIERSLANPSINSLKVIAQALDVPLFYFFKEDSNKKDLVVRGNMRKTIGFPEQDVTYDLLTPDISGNIEFCMMHIPPNTDSVKVPMSHEGEEVAYVVEGEVELLVGAVTYSLSKEDSVRIPPFTDHKWINNSDSLVKVVFAVSPPSF